MFRRTHLGDQDLINALEPVALLVVTPVGLLGQLTVAAEVGVVDLATDNNNRAEEGQQKFPLRFVKQPAVCNRPVRISLRLSMGVDEGTLQSSIYSPDGLLFSSG